MAINELPNSITVSGSPPCSTVSQSSKVDAPLSLSCRASQTALAFQSNAALAVQVRPTPVLSLASSQPAPAHQPELSPLCIPAIPTALSADTPSQTTAVAGPEGHSSHNGLNKDLSSGSQEGELEDSVESSDVEIFLSSLGLENAVLSARTSTAPDSESVPEGAHVSPANTRQQQTACKVSNVILSPQLPPAPLQQTIPLPDVASDGEGHSAPKKPAASLPSTAPQASHDAEKAEANVAARLTPSNSQDIQFDDCINIDNSNKTPNVYINGLPPHFPEEQLYALAAPYGPIRSVRTFTRHVKESESGYGFVLFETIEAAEKCIMSLRRYRNLHPTFSKQVHKIPGIAYTQLSSLPSDLSNDSPELSNKWGQNGSDGDMTFKEKMESLQDPASTNLYMEGLPLSIDEATLAALVSPHRISSSRFFQTRLSNPPRIIAFVRLETRTGAEEIIERLHGRMVRGWNDTGSRISVRFADTAEQRELRRAERVNKDGEQSPARLTIAQAALLNMRGQELRQRPSSTIPAHQSLPDRLDRLRVDGSLYSDFPNTRLSPTGLTVDYSLGPNASYVSPRLHTSISAPYISSQKRDSISPNVDPTMLTLLDSLRGNRSFHNGDYASHDNDIQYNIRPQVPSRTPHVLEDFSYGTPQYPLRNGYTPTEEYIMRAHAESATLRQGRRLPPLDFYRRRGDSDAAASITLGVRGQRAQASTITIPQQKVFPHSNVSEVHNVIEDDFQSSAPLAHELRPRTQQLEVRQDSAVRNKNISHVNVRLSREAVHSKCQQAPPMVQQSLQSEQYPAGHTRCSTLPHRSSSSAQHQRHYQHNSMSVPSTTHTQDTISAILSSMNQSNSLASSKPKPSNNDTTIDHASHDRHESTQLKIGNRLSFDNVKGATQLEKHNTRLLRDCGEVEQSSSSLASPALTYSSHTPSTLSPATPFFGSFASQSDGFEQHGTGANKLKACKHWQIVTYVSDKRDVTRNLGLIMSSPLRTPKRPTAPKNAYHSTTPTYHQRPRIRSHVGSSPLNDKTPAPSTRRVSKSDSMVFADLGGNASQRTEDPLKSIMKQKFRARCLERAAKAREEQVRRRRYASGYPSSEPSSDGCDEAMDEDDEDDDDDTVMQDELFQRIVESSFRKSQHSYRVSYALEVGSSFDPDLEDMAKWEEELHGDDLPSTSSSALLRSESLALPDYESDEDELAVYAEDLAAIAELEDIPEDELFGWSDFEDDTARSSTSGQVEDDDMCTN